MTNNKKAHGSCSCRTPKTSTYSKKDMPIITREYERGTRWAGWLFVGLFVFLSLGVVMFGW